MKTVQQILLKAICLGVLIMGILLLMYGLLGFTDLVIQYLPQHLAVRWTLKIVAVLVAAFCLVPAKLFAKKRRRISFPSAHGTNDCYLDSLESSLNKALAKLPQVRKTALELLPAANGRMIRINGEVWLANTQSGGFRETSAYISEKVAVEAKRRLGVDEVDTVHLSFHYPKLDLDLGDSDIDLEEEVRKDGPGREATDSEVIVGPDAHFAEDAESYDEDDASGAEVSEEDEALEMEAPEEETDGADDALPGSALPGLDDEDESDDEDSEEDQWPPLGDDASEDDEEAKPLT